MSTDEVIEEEIPLRLCLLMRTTQVQPAFDAELRAGCRRLPTVVGLNQRTPHEHIAAFVNRIGEEELVVACLVATENQSSAVVALDENAYPTANLGGESRGFLEGRGKVREANARQFLCRGANL